MATVGEQLTAPEVGWKRYDDTDSNINYIGSWTRNTGADANSLYNGTQIGTTVHDSNSDLIVFNFTGEKLRIIQQTYTNRSQLIQVTIDGIVRGTYSEYGNNRYQVLLYEISNLSDSEHSCEIKNISSGYLGLDAIDIDENGELKPYTPITAPTNLTVVAGDSKITLSWNAVVGATSYIIKRSTTSGGTYETIASGVTDTSYVDTSVTNGTTYYYVVVAVNADGESKNSNEASATPVDGSSKVLLRITMSDSSEREYKVSTAEKDNFIKWFNSSDVVVETSSYEFNKDINGSKEYVAFDKIISFETVTNNSQTLLRITMSDSSEREYKVTADMFDTFVKWFNRSNVSVRKTSYLFNKDIDGGKEYLSFDKIISFEVIEIK